MATFRRRNKFPKPALQASLVWNFIAVGLFFLSVQYIFARQALHGIAAEGNDPQLHTVLLDEAFRSYFKTALLFVPFAIITGVLATFRVAGPLYRFERFLESITKGENPGRCTLRRGDALMGLCEHINQAVETLRQAQPTDAQDSDGEPEETKEKATVASSDS